MINLSRRAAAVIAVLLSLVLVLTLALSATALAMRGPAAESAVPTATPEPATATPTATPEPATDTPSVTPEPATGTPSATPEPATDTPSATATPEPATDTPSATATPEPATDTPVTFQCRLDCHGQGTASPTPSITPSPTPAPVNLLGNASFEQPPNITETRWTFDPVTSAAEGDWSETFGKTGTHALFIESRIFRQGGLPGWNTAAPIAIESGKTYTFSAWASSPDGAKASISVDMYDAKDRFLVGYSTPCLTVSQGWEQLSVEVSNQKPIAARATQVRLGLKQCFSTADANKPVSSSVFYDDVFFGVMQQ